MIRVKLEIEGSRGDVETYSASVDGTWETKAGAVPLIFRVVRAALAARSGEVAWINDMIRMFTNLSAIVNSAQGPVDEERSEGSV